VGDVGEDLLDHCGFFDAGDDPDRSALSRQVSMSMLNTCFTESRR
jgi:hypothetical protein